MYIIRTCQSGYDGRPRGRRRCPRRRILVHQEGNLADAEAERKRVTRRPRAPPGDLEDGDAETPDSPRGEGPPPAVLAVGRPRPSPGLLRAERALLEPVPGGIHAHDPGRAPIHRSEARSGCRG